ncbi:MAG: NADPH:quinone reductase [Bacillales bacterium]|jgi:zinc-binding alcohol dehydrogenase family protein|nr:NADPH:quinone reductase [Bacillales bacterium]
MNKKMKAIGLIEYLPIENEFSLMDFELEIPKPTGKELLVAIKAVSVNPVDTKVRSPKPIIESQPKVLGWDAAGVVVGIGEDVSLFNVGDEVFYAGSITKPGSNSEFHLVDERIVAKKPSVLGFAEAAAIPLTAITAWEGLFERLTVPFDKEKNSKRNILIIGGAGGVGSIAIQLAKYVGLTVIATASRPETIEWAKNMGADFIIDHNSDNFLTELEQLDLKGVDYIFCLNKTDQHWMNMVNVINPLGKICSIVETTNPINIYLLKDKSVTFSWEFMFARSKYETEDMIVQHEILEKIALLIDQSILKSTMTKRLTPINATNLREAHKQLESGKMIGKLVLEGF